MPRLVAAYARVSTERQAERQTIEQQVESLLAYAERQGWRLPSERIYRDDGCSGARLDRPALDRLRDGVARGEVDTILVTSPDRLARRYAYQVWLLEEFEKAGCQVVFLERPPSGDPQDALLIQIRGAVAEYERTVIADRMRRGRLAALRAGRLLPWSTPPFGYVVDPHCARDPSGVHLDEEQAAIVRQVFRWYVEEGLTLYGIARRLTEWHVPTAAGRAVWSPSSVRKMLVNPAYQGTTYGNQKQNVPAARHYPLLGREPKGRDGLSWRPRPTEEWIAVAVPAIVSTELFAAAQERLGKNQQWASRNTRGEYLLRRLVSCGRCGLAHNVWNNGRYAYYRCKGMGTLICRERPEACHARQVATERLDALVWEDLRHLLSEPTVIEEALGRARQGWLETDEREAHQRGICRRQAEVQRQIERLVDAYTVGVLTLSELQSRRTKLEERLAVLRREEQQLLAQAVQESQLAAIAGRLEEFRTAIAQGLEQASFAQKRTIVELLVDRVVVDAPEVEIRYVLPISGAAQRKGVLRSRYREVEQGDQAPQQCSRHLSQPGIGDPAGGGGTDGAARRVGGGQEILQRGVADEDAKC